MVLLKIRVNRDLDDLIETLNNAEYFTEIFQNEHGEMTKFLAVLQYSVRYFCEYIRRHLHFPYDASDEFTGESNADKVQEGITVNRHIFIYLRSFVYNPILCSIGALGELSQMVEDFIECLDTFANYDE